MKFKKFRNTILEDARLTKVRTFFLEALKDYGILLWHTSSNGKSTYLKFRDCRLGTIRISNHECQKNTTTLVVSITNWIQRRENII